MEEVGQRTPRPVRVPVPRPPPPPESLIRTLRSVAYSLGLSLRAFMMLLWRACRLPAGQDDDDGEPKNEKQATVDGQGDEARQRKSEENAKKRAKKKAKKAARKEAKPDAEAEAKKRAMERRQAEEAEKKRQEEEEAARQEEEAARQEEEAARQEEEEARQEEEEARRKKAESDMKNAEKLVAERKKAEQEEMKLRQREEARIRAEETMIMEEEAERKREDNRRRRAEADNKNEYELERDAHRSFWDENLASLKENQMTLCMVCHFENKSFEYGCTHHEKNRHIGSRHKGGVEECKKAGCFVIAKDKSQLGQHQYYSHNMR